MSGEKAGTLSPTWGEESMTWWDRKTKLEKKLIVVLIVSVGLLSGCLIFYTMKPPSGIDGVCTSSACLEAASLIVTHIDRSVDPCDDFFKFACGRFIENTHGDLKATSIKEIKAQVQRQIEELINEPISDDDHDFLKKQKQFIQECLNETAVEEEAMEVLQEHLQDLNGWPVVVGYKWRERYFDWLNMIIKLKRLGYPFEMLMSFRPAPDPKNSSNIILMIDAPNVKHVIDSHKDLYKAVITEIAVAFGADRARATIEMEKVLDFQEKLHEVVQHVKLQEGELEKTRFTIAEFQEFNNEIDWLDFINALLYPAANVTSEDHVIFPPNEFMEGFFGLIYKIPKRIQANYMIWSAIEPTISFLPKKIQQLMGNYSCLADAHKVEDDRNKFCNDLISYSYIPKPSDIIYARKYLPEEKKDKVEEILANIKSEYITTVQETDWLDEESKANAVGTIESVKEIIGSPGNYFNDSIFDMFEDIYPEDSDYKEMSFFEKVLFYSTVDSNYLFSNFKNQQEIKLFYHMTTIVNAAYLPSYNYLMVPAALLQGIMFDYQRPMYLNYGSVGSIIAHELTHAVVSESTDLTKSMAKDDAWTEETTEAYGDIITCMIDSAENFDVEGTNNTINGTQTLEENIADFVGTKVAYKAYKKWVSENGAEPELPGIDYTPQQLFWISSILHECYKLSGEKLEAGLEFDSHANNAFRATGPIRNNPDFANDFNCAVDSNMNPSEKCQIF